MELIHAQALFDCITFVPYSRSLNHPIAASRPL